MPEKLIHLTKTLKPGEFNTPHKQDMDAELRKALGVGFHRVQHMSQSTQIIDGSLLITTTLIVTTT